jgi:hypothetical protein
MPYTGQEVYLNPVQQQDILAQQIAVTVLIILAIEIIKLLNYRKPRQ